MIPTDFSVLPSEPGTARAPSAARLAAEALFSAVPAAVADDRAAPQVLVKRRRRLETAVQDESPEEDRDGDRPDGRAPRTHRLSSTAPRAPGDAPGEDSALAPSAASRPGRRVRKARNGKVTIIRPQADEIDASFDAPAGDGLQPAPVATGSPWPQSLRYPKLLARIRVLEQEALALRQREATVRWIVQAIRSYSLTAQDVGF